MRVRSGPHLPNLRAGEDWVHASWLSQVDVRRGPMEALDQQICRQHTIRKALAHHMFAQHAYLVEGLSATVVLM